MNPKINYDDSCQWKSPEDAIQEWSSVCQFGENDKPFQVTECFQVWGRGRPRPQLSEIKLPTFPNQNSHGDKQTYRVQVDRPQLPVASKGRGHGRGRLLLIDEDEEIGIHDLRNLRDERKKGKPPITLAEMSDPKFKENFSRNKNSKNFGKFREESIQTGKKKDSDLPNLTPQNDTHTQRLWFDNMIGNSFEQQHIDKSLYDLKKDFPALQ